MKPYVYATKILPKEIQELIEESCTLGMWEGKESISKEALYENVKEAKGLITSGTPIDKELLDHAPSLKVVSNYSVGYDNFDLDEMAKRNVVGTHTPYTLDNTVADLAFALILSSARRISELDRYIRNGKWVEKDSKEIFGTDVHHQTLGIIGMGRIGEAVAKRAKFGFDMEVLYHNRNRKPEAEEKFGVIYQSLDDLLKKSDFVLMITPLTEETYHMIGKEEFKKMKSSAHFINVSRGKTVDEEALIEALTNGTIAGAGLDVFQQEPINEDNPLLEMENVTLAPHIGSATEIVRLNMFKQAAKNTIEVVHGRKAPNPVKELKDI